VFFGTDTKFWTYHMHQRVKKEIETKISCLLLYKVRMLALGPYNYMVVEYKTRIHQKEAIFEGFSGNLMFETDVIYGDSPITPLRH